MLVSTNARYLEDDKIISSKDSRKLDLEIESLILKLLNLVEVSNATTIQVPQAVEPHRSGRIPKVLKE